jgi:hypothetical protein
MLDNSGPEADPFTKEPCPQVATDQAELTRLSSFREMTEGNIRLDISEIDEDRTNRCESCP